MQTRIKPRKKPVVPTHSIISDLGEVAEMVMTSTEIEIFNAYFHFKDISEVSVQYRHNEWYVCKNMVSAIRKIVYLYKLPSLSKFHTRRLTRKQFLEAPIKYHGFSTRLYHSLLNVEVFSLQEIINLGVKKMKYARGMGNKGIDEIKEILNQHGCAHLFK